MKIYLIRHGQSEGNVRNLWYGITDLPLTDLGRQQAAQVGEKLRDVPLAAAYISPLCRASETADIALRGRDEVRRVIVPDLREQNMGRLEPMSVADIRREMPEYLDALMRDWVHTPPVEGEPYDTGMAPRVARALDDIVARGEDCAIFAHNGPLCFAMTHLLGLPMETALRFYFHQGCYTVIQLGCHSIDEQGTVLQGFNL